MRVALIVLGLIGGWLALSTTDANAVVCARGIYRAGCVRCRILADVRGSGWTAWNTSPDNA